LYRFLGLNFCPASAWVRSGYGHGTIAGMLDTGVWLESPSFDERGMLLVPVRWTSVCPGGERFNVSNCNRKLPPNHRIPAIEKNGKRQMGTSERG
jgi:hypothetical protein